MRNKELKREYCHPYDRDSFCLTFLSSQREIEKQIDRGKQIDQQTERQTDRQRETESYIGSIVIAIKRFNRLKLH